MPHGSRFLVEGGRLSVDGTLGAADHDVLRGAFDELLATACPVVTVDLTGVDSISSLCVGTLVALLLELREKRRALDLQTSPAVKRVLDLVGLTTVLMAHRAGP